MFLCKKKLIGLVGFLIACSSCGRKSQTIYRFEQEKEKKITKLSLPAVRGTHVVLKKDGNIISWQPVDQNLYQSLEPNVLFVGYHVYRFFLGGGVPHKPITKEPVKETMYQDAYKKPACYLVRCVFQRVQEKDKIIIGPAGQSVSSI